MVIKKNTFAGLQLLNTFCLPRAYEIGLLCSAHAALVCACTAANRIYAYSAEASLNRTCLCSLVRTILVEMRQRRGISVE